MRSLVDLHQLGMGHTGNETWARNALVALEAAGGGGAFSYAVTSRAALPVDVPAARTHVVSGSSVRRLVLDLPRLLRHLSSTAVVCQYTLPVTKVPGVVVVHDLSFTHREARQWIPPLELARYRATIGGSIRRARAVVVPSRYTRDELIAAYGTDPERVVVAPLALDPGLAQALQREAGGEVSRGTVLAVGTVLPRKNLPTLAVAVARLRSQGVPCRLRLVGPVRSAGEADLARMREVLGDGLEVVGGVSQEQLAQEYARADVVAFPSLFEGFGLPLLEAMAAGRPLVSSDATCLPEVAGEAALLVPPRDPEAWAAALRTALEDDETRRRLGDAGRSRLENFSWQVVADGVRRAVELARQ